MFLITCAIAVLGAWIGKKLRIPSGVMIGAIICVAIINIFFGLAPIPPAIKTFTQIIAGAFVGASLDQKSIQKLRTLTRPAIIMTTTLLATNILLGLLLYYISPLDLCTALFATVPGGIAEMTIISEDMGANTPLVSVFQLSRVVLINCLFPLFISYVFKAKKNPDMISGSHSRKDKKSWTQTMWLEFLITISASALAGFAGKKIGFPGGALLFSALISGFLKVRFQIGFIPKIMKRFAQTLVGAYVGAQVTLTVARSATSLWPYVAVIVFFYLIFCLVTGWYISRTTAMDSVTAAFSCAPAGASEMSLIASEFEVDSAAIAVLHMIRLMMVVAVCPGTISILTKLIS